jgi:uncharacterized protein YhfF
VTPSLEDVAAGRSEPDVTAWWLRVRPKVERDPFARIGVVVGQSGAQALTPPAFSFGATREQADELLALVLAGVKTATSSALVEYQREGEPLPQVGGLAIVLDGAGQPRAVLRTTAVELTTFGRVGADHAAAEGEGDRTLATWRAEHAAFWGRRADDADDWPVVLERFALVHPRGGG